MRSKWKLKEFSSIYILQSNRAPQGTVPTPVMPENWPTTKVGINFFPQKQFPIWWQQLSPVKGMSHHVCHRKCLVPTEDDLTNYFWNHEICPKKYPLVLADIPLKLIVPNFDIRCINFITDPLQMDVVNFMDCYEQLFVQNRFLKPSIVIFKLERFILPSGELYKLSAKAEVIVDNLIQASDETYFMISDKVTRGPRYARWIYEAQGRILKLLRYHQPAPLTRTFSCEF